MVANLSYYQEQYGERKPEMAYVEEYGVPWHGEGNALDSMVNSYEMLDASHLNWQCRKVLVHHMLNYYYVWRNDENRPLGIVKQRYKIFQNDQVAAFMHNLLKVTGLGVDRVETAGALGFGEVIWMSARLEQFDIMNKDRMIPYLTIRSTHDGSGKIEAFVSYIRVVCQNTLTAALDNAKFKIGIRHTGSLEGHQKEAESTYAMSVQNRAKVRELCDFLATTMIDGDQVKRFLDLVFPIPEDTEKRTQRTMDAIAKRKEKVTMLHDMGRGSNDWRGTAWGLFNAYTEYNDHMRSIKGKGKRWIRSFFNGEEKREEALNAILEVV